MRGSLAQAAVGFKCVVVLLSRRNDIMKSNHKSSFNQILRSVSFLNVRNLIDKAQLASSLAWQYPHHRRVLSRIEQGARAQLQAIAGLSFGTAVTAD